MPSLLPPTWAHSASKPEQRVCPECAGPLVRGSACLACAVCGWGRCG